MIIAPTASVFGIAKRRVGAQLTSAATAGEGTQNLLCAYLAVAVFAGLLANTVFGAWWLDGTVALAIAGWAVIEGRPSLGREVLQLQPPAQRVLLTTAAHRSRS
jgi:divalent metal cation (Fe/Co/Zn/Cd) transporter